MVYKNVGRITPENLLFDTTSIQAGLGEIANTGIFLGQDEVSSTMISGTVPANRKVLLDIPDDLTIFDAQGPIYNGVSGKWNPIGDIEYDPSTKVLLFKNPSASVGDQFRVIVFLVRRFLP